MKKFIQNKLREGLLIENDTIYNDKIVDAVTKKIGDTSDDTKNKINIAGLWRDYFGNIQQLKSKEQLGDVFKLWYDKMISDMIKTKSFYNNKDLSEKYLDAYIENIGSLGDKATRFSLKKIEKGLVDLVNNNNWIKDTSVSTNSIYEPHSDDILDENDDIIILNAPNKAKCVTYGQKESWCIGKPELNYYNTYRLSYGATPYYVLQKNVEGNEHKLVIMNYGNGDYAIADRSNSGNRHGGKDVSMSWSQIEQEIPNLKGKEQLLKYREITEDERRYAEALEKRYEGDDLQSYFDKLSKELVVNGENVKSVDIVRDYVANQHIVTPEQFNGLRDEVKDSLMESGYFLIRDSEGYNLTDKQLGRIARLKLSNDRRLNYRELMVLSDDERVKYIRNLDKGDILDLVAESSNPDSTIKLLGQKGIYFIQNLDEYGIAGLLNDSKNKDSIIKILFDDEYFIENLSKYSIKNLLKYSSNPESIIKLLGQKGIDFIDVLDTYNIKELIIYSSNPESIIKLLGQKGIDYINNLSNGSPFDLLIYSHKPESIIKLLGQKGIDYINNLGGSGIKELLIYSPKPESIIKLLGQKGIDYINNLDGSGIKYLMTHSHEPDKLKPYLKKVRPDLFQQNESINLIKKLLRESFNKLNELDNFDFNTLPEDIKNTLFNEYDIYSHKTFDWNSKADELSNEEFREFIYNNKNISIINNIDDIILKTTQDMVLLKKRELSNKKLTSFEDLIIPVLGNDVLIPTLTRFQQLVLLDPNASIETIEKGFNDTKNIINKNGDLNYDKIDTDLVNGTNHPLDLNSGNKSINLPNFERFVSKNPDYKGVFNDWKKLFDENNSLSMKELHAYRDSTPIDKIRNLRRVLIKIKNNK